MISRTKRRDIQVLAIGTDTTALRCRTWERPRFEIEYALQRGTTTNAYLIRGEKTALFDPPGETFTEIFLTALKELVDPGSIDYLILGHVNHFRSHTLKALLELAPNLTIVCSNPGAMILRSIFPERELNLIIVRGDDTLDLGKGHLLQFIPTPNPRWPDLLCTFDRVSRVLYTDKLFGAHICNEHVLDEGWMTIDEDRRYYFDCVMAPNAEQVAKALDKLQPFDALLYATGHGPLAFYSLSLLSESYRQWCGEQRSQEIRVALIYASAYGSTATLARAIALGITKAGVGVETINCEIAEPDEIEAAVAKADGFIMGSPTLGGHAPTPIQTAMGIVISTASKNKLAGVFGSYGWSGEAIDLLENKFRDAGYKFGFEPIRVKFSADDVTLKYCEEAGTDFAQTLKKAKKFKKTTRHSVSNSQADRTEQAVERIIGPLCVLTAKRGELSRAMLADWISQASFTPPGLTVSVAKERAIESLMHVGDRFVVNILEEGKHQELMKHFLKPFAPGEDRLLGLATEESKNGSPILTDSLAYVECMVENRMECGDYWLIYGVIDNGQVFDSNGRTAIHHRKFSPGY